jgi:GTP pyrophosphokinase
LPGEISSDNRYHNLMDDEQITQWMQRVIEPNLPAHAGIIQKSLELANTAHADQVRASGEPYINHVLAVAETLADLRMDYETVCAALLHEVPGRAIHTADEASEDSRFTLEQVCQQIGDPVCQLVAGVAKLDELRTGAEGDVLMEASQAESLRKMLLAMAQDVRVVLIKLADRLHNMQTVGHLPESQQKHLAAETLEIYAPLANRLGIWQIKWALEDLSFRVLHPESFRKLASALDRKRHEREAMIAEVSSQVSELLKKEGIAADIKGRPKHIYSIWRKMQRKNLPFEQLFDIQAIRILVDDVAACYTALGIVHSLWKHISQEFDDYIANPKENGYQSLHTAVVGPDGHPLEVQIRTYEMHQYAEYGVAAHWRYKEQASHDERMQQEINWLRQILEWRDQEQGAGDFIDRFKAEVFQERIYVLTPQGRIVDLPSGATPIDFAYHIHTQVGHQCRGARVNGKMVPLTHVLRNGEQVEILTSSQGQPSRDWMNPHLGYTVSARARSSIRHWFRQQDYDRNLNDGRIMMDKELHRVGLKQSDIKAIHAHFNFNSIDDLYAAIGRGEVTPLQVINAMKPSILKQENLVQRAPKKDSYESGQNVIVEGVGNLLTQIANCCKPVPYEPIIGFITKGSGVRIHRQDCSNIINLDTEKRQRLIDVSWSHHIDTQYTVDIDILAYDRSGLLRDITNVFANDNINVRAVDTRSIAEDNTARMRLTVEITDMDQLIRVLGRIAAIPSVFEVQRRA